MFVDSVRLHAASLPGRTSVLFMGLVYGLSGCVSDIQVRDVLPTVVEDPDVVEIDQVQTDLLRVHPPVLSFGEHAVGCDPVLRPVFLENIGDVSLTLAMPTMLGDTAPFESHDYKVTLAPGTTTVVGVTYQPQQGGLLSEAMWVLEDTASGSRGQVTLRGEAVEAGPVEEVFQQVEPAPVDVLFVVDNSGSMAGDLRDLAGAFDAFLDEFLTLDMDFHLGVITTDMQRPNQSGALQGPIITPYTPNPFGEFGDQTARGSSGSGNEAALDAVQAALSSPLVHTVNQGFLREDASLAIAVVSDEDDESVVSVPAFLGWLDGLATPTREISVSALAGPAFGQQGSVCANGNRVAPAPRYHEVIEATGGVWTDLCWMDFGPFLADFARRAAGLQNTFVLQSTPDKQEEISVWVDGAPVPYSETHGWTLSDGGDAVVFHGEGTPGAGAEVRVSYWLPMSCSG